MHFVSLGTTEKEIPTFTSSFGEDLVDPIEQNRWQ